MEVIVVIYLHYMTLLLLSIILQLNSNKTNVYSVQLGEDLTFVPNFRLKIGLTPRGAEGVIDLPPIK